MVTSPKISLKNQIINSIYTFDYSLTNLIYTFPPSNLQSQSDFIPGYLPIGTYKFDCEFNHINFPYDDGNTNKEPNKYGNATLGAIPSGTAINFSE